MYGYIPDKISIVHSGLKKIYDSVDKRELEVVPAFILDSENKKKMKTALSWARQKKYYSNKKAIPKVITKENVPFCFLQILATEYCYRKGYLLKVIDEDGFYFNIHNEVLLEAISNDGMKKGGIFNGKFIWAVIKNETKIVRVGSHLHTNLLEANKMHKSKILKQSELKPGDVCQSKSGNIGVFLGFVSGKEIKFKNNIAYSKTADYSFTEINFKKKSLWWQPSKASEDYEKNFLKTLVTKTPTSYNRNYSSWNLNYQLKTSHVFRKIINKINVPGDVIEQIRMQSLLVTKEKELKARAKFKAGEYSNYYYSLNDVKQAIAYEVFPTYGDKYPNLSWIRKVGEPEPIVTQYDFLLK